MFGAHPRVSSSSLFLERRSALILLCSVPILSYLLPMLEGKLINNPQTVWPLWPSCAILVAGLTFVRNRVWPLLITASLAGIVLFDLQIGVPLKSIGWFVLGDTVEVLIIAYGLRYSFGGVPQLDTIGDLAKYSLYAFMGCLSGAFLSANGIGLGYWTGWKICFFSEMLAFVTLTPAILSWGSHYLRGTRRSRAYYRESLAQLSGLIVFGLLAFASSQQRHFQPVLLYSLIPFLLWAALRLGSTGVSSSIIIVCFLTIWGAVHGRGPFTEQGPLLDPSAIQLFLVFASAPFLILTAVVEERKRTQDALSNVSGRLIQAQEQERTRIARELHDDIGQRFALVSIALGRAQTSLTSDTAVVREHLNDVRDQVTQIASDLQAVAHELHSSTLEFLGLVKAAQGWCREIGQRRKIDISFSSRDVPSSLTPEISVCVFRILQEAVHNACKHSGVERIEIELWGTSNAIHLKVSDLGKGFDVNDTPQNKGLGLTSMRERVRLAQGKLQVDSIPMRGTTICAYVPLISEKAV
jgi:signal transduction histidine kinase